MLKPIGSAGEHLHDGRDITELERTHMSVCLRDKRDSGSMESVAATRLAGVSRLRNIAQVARREDGLLAGDGLV